MGHELGEHVAGEVFRRLAVDPSLAMPGMREEVANQLASRLLLPTAWFVINAQTCDWDLLTLKARYRTASHELIARRMLDSQPPVIVTVCDQGQITFRRSNLMRRAVPLAPVEHACWHEVHQRAALRCTMAGPSGSPAGRCMKPVGSGRSCAPAWSEGADEEAAEEYD